MSRNIPPEYWYYSVSPIFKRVSKEEYEEYLKHYPRPLEPDYYGVFEPPLITWNDFQLADRWPFSVVARTYPYLIAENIEEVFASKTGRTAEEWETYQKLREWDEAHKKSEEENPPQVGQPERSPKIEFVGKAYCYITDVLKIDMAYDMETDVDMMRKEIGNYFKSYSAAMNILNRICEFMNRKE